MNQTSRQIEEAYFAKLEFERKRKVEAEKHKYLEKEEKEKLKKLHYMCCPKCGQKLIEIDFNSVLIDKCSSCNGIWLDAGELEQIIKKEKTLINFFDVFKIQ